MLQNLGTNVKILGKLKMSLEMQRNSTSGERGEAGWDKRRFKLLHFTIQLFHSPSLLHYSTLQ